MITETIAAISTALSPSGIGIVRMSGEEAFSIIEKVFKHNNNPFIVGNVDSHTVHHGVIVDNLEIIDEVLVVILKQPNTFTKENTVEINCHGGVYVVKRVLECLLKAGARLAQPGEFTKRAFLNGRLDLMQAESVIDLIHASNEFARKSSIAQLNGVISKRIKQMRQEVLHEIAFIESALDDPEHISLEGYPKELNQKIKTILINLEQMIKNSDNGRILKEGIQTVIVGKPNVGKSSLLNILMGQDRAIVTEIAGTTRDVLEEQINLDGITLNIVDTAGIRETNDVIEQIGVKKSKEYLVGADLIIYIIDGSVPLDENDHEIISMVREKKVIVLVNKSDLNQAVQIGSLYEIMDFPIISVSVKEMEGLKELEKKIKDLFFNGEITSNMEEVITNMRHKESLVHAYDSLLQVEISIENQMPEDFFSIDLRSACDCLGEITGESVGDDLVNEIFSKFCMGK